MPNDARIIREPTTPELTDAENHIVCEVVNLLIEFESGSVSR